METMESKEEDMLAKNEQEDDEEDYEVKFGS